MYKNLREFIQYLWGKNCSTPFSEQALMEQLHRDSQQESQDIGAELVKQLLDGKEDVDWDCALFICSEAFLRYRAQEQDMSPEQVVCAIFAMCVVSDSSRIDEYLTHVLVLCGILAQRVEKEWDQLLDRENFEAEDLKKFGPKIDEDDLLFLSIYLFAKDDKRIPPPLC